MRLCIFQSESRPALDPFASDEQGSMLPRHHEPCKVTGVVGATSAPYSISRNAVEEAIATHGFQLWRKKPRLLA
jgi:hypothetical protein